MNVAKRLAAVRGEIAAAGRDPEEVTVVAVTKGFGPEAVVAAYDAGLRDFGENYAAELEAKVGAVPRDGTRWHFLGAIQRNKVKAMSGHVHLWHGVDRPAAAGEIAKRAPGAAVLVQVNLAGAPGRNGCGWDEAPSVVEQARALGLDVRGLMGVAGLEADARSQFRRLAALARSLGLAELSMGMSDDLNAALEEGSTIVRVGTALFGARPGAAQMRR